MGAVYVDDTWRRRYNNELMEMYGDLDVISFIKLNRLRWIGHVSRMDANKKVHQVCYIHPQGKRLRGRPKNRWWDSVQKDISKCKIKCWTQLAKDRGIWRRTLQEAEARIGL